ncbi:MAG: NAD(P)-binding domain-containing protein [Bacteroidetes bacterium]|nr:NAD(P)-binding domain-containing protein [Bacteroidota bacterium]
MKKKIGIIGSGTVAQVLAAGFIKNGHEVTLGTSNPAKLADFKSKNPAAAIASFEEAAKFGAIVVLAVKGHVAESVVKSLAPHLIGKPVMDATNPIAEKPPVNGVLQFFTSLNDSLMERLQALAPQANFVKAFNSVGSPHMVDPSFGGAKPTMFICGNNDDAKKEVADIINSFGWEAADFGKAESARAIEPLCMLWCIPGMLRNEWSHAFKLLKK